jgi:NAD(P)H-flavin reductase
MYREEIEAMQATHKNFRAVITASRPDATWKHASGYVQDALKNHRSTDKQKIRVYICGKPEIAEKLVEFCVNDMQLAHEQVLLEKW